MDSVELVGLVASFLLEKYAITIAPSFFERKDDDNYYWVYGSKKDSITSVIYNPFYPDRPYKFFETEKNALEFRDKLINNGYDAYVFNGESHGLNTKISKGFENASLERKIELVIHETLHYYFSINDDKFPDIPYSVEEPIVTYAGKALTEEFIRINFPERLSMFLDSHNKWNSKVTLFVTYFELLTEHYAGEKKYADREDIFEEFANLFKKKEIVNNAYFIRMHDYMALYPVVQEYFKDKRRTVKALLNPGTGNMQVLMGMMESSTYNSIPYESVVLD